MSAAPLWLTVLAAAMTFTVMLSLGLLLRRDEVAAALRKRMVLAAIIFGVVVPVPALAVVLVKLMNLQGPAALGIVLMSISPGAPIALRRAIAAGGHARFAPALHLVIVLIAVVTVPLSIEVLNVIAGAMFDVSALDVGRQVFVAQLLPIGLGAATLAFWPAAAARARPAIEKLSNLLFLALVLACFYLLGGVLNRMGWIPAVAGAVLSVCAIAIGSACAGSDTEARAPAAVAAAMRNPGLALLIAGLNDVGAGVGAAVFGYAVGAAVVVTAYIAWQVRSRRT